jgi:hypothetical protein
MKYLTMEGFRNLSFAEQQKHYNENLANSDDFSVWEKALVEAIKTADIAPIEAYPLLHIFFNKIVVEKSGNVENSVESFLIENGLAKSHAKFFKSMTKEVFFRHAPLFEGLENELSPATLKAVAKLLTLIPNVNE